MKTTEMIECGREDMLRDQARRLGPAVHSGLISRRELTDVLMRSARQRGLVGEAGSPAVATAIFNGLAMAEGEPLDLDRPQTRWLH